MQLSPAILETAYRYLAETPPFDGWNMPDAEEVKFALLRDGHTHGQVDPPKNGRGYLFDISEPHHQHTSSLIATMAHEMVHLHLHQSGYRGWKSHGKVFKALAKEVCYAHGFDPGQF